MFENPRRGRQARNFTTNVPKIVDLKSSSEQIFSENCRWVPLFYCIAAFTWQTQTWRRFERASVIACGVTYKGRCKVKKNYLMKHIIHSVIEEVE